MTRNWLFSAMSLSFLFVASTEAQLLVDSATIHFTATKSAHIRFDPQNPTETIVRSGVDSFPGDTAENTMAIWGGANYACPCCPRQIFSWSRPYHVAIGQEQWVNYFGAPLELQDSTLFARVDSAVSIVLPNSNPSHILWREDDLIVLAIKHQAPNPIEWSYAIVEIARQYVDSSAEYFVLGLPPTYPYETCINTATIRWIWQLDGSLDFTAYDTTAGINSSGRSAPQSNSRLSRVERDQLQMVDIQGRSVSNSQKTTAGLRIVRLVSGENGVAPTWKVVVPGR